MIIEKIAAKIGVSLAMKLAKPAIDRVKQGSTNTDYNKKAAEVTKTFNEIYDFMKENKS